MEIMGSKMDHSKLDTNPSNSKKQQMLIVVRGRREVKVVSSEENGKSRTYKTYRNLDIEYNKKEEKSRQRK